MFTGIIEALGQIESVSASGTNKTYKIRSGISNELKVDQSVSHDGVCLTVESVSADMHTVTAIAETLEVSRLAEWKAGDKVNLERCLAMNGRLDGHMVQGHVDSTAVCLGRTDREGSWEFRFRFPREYAVLIVEKGSVAVNGVSLTCFDVSADEFRVAIIPFTYDHTNLSAVRADSVVNIEFDLIGKYVQRMQQVAGYGSESLPGTGPGFTSIH